MFVWCLPMIIAEAAAAHATTGGGSPSHQAISGNEPAARIDANETYRLASTTIVKTASVPAVASGEIARNAPQPVATPLPPLNPRKTVKTWQDGEHCGDHLLLPAGAQPAGDCDGEIPLSPVQQERQHSGPLALSEYVGRPDVSAARAADVRLLEDPDEKVSEWDGSDEVTGKRNRNPECHLVGCPRRSIRSSTV